MMELSVDKDSALIAPYSFSRNNGTLVSKIDDEKAHILIRTGTANALALSEIRRVVGKPLEVLPIDPASFDAALEGAYNAVESDDTLAFVHHMAADSSLEHLAAEIPDLVDLLDEESEAPLIRFINRLITQALNGRASDIHFERFESRSVARFRIDGLLTDVIEPPRALHNALISRIKIMADLDIAEKRLPQDGRITMKIGGRKIDIRVAVAPTGHGERVTLRLLDKRNTVLDLQRLGMPPDNVARIDKIIRRPHGIFLVTGPTGSGKTTTLYASISRLDTRSQNIMTVEDPVEYDLDGVSQVEVRPAIGLTFASTLRSLLRHDPDILMVGEIRDFETAQIAIQASLTGHLVLATLHTNDSVGAIARLIDMGVQPFLLSSCLLGAMAQRLVRKLCPECSEDHQVPEAIWTSFNTAGSTGRHHVGCEKCNQTGYSGRTGVYEIFTNSEGLSRLIHDRASEQAMREYVATLPEASNLRSEIGKLVAAGMTSPEEALRVMMV